MARSNYVNWYGNEDQEQELDRLRAYHRDIFLSGSISYGGRRVLTENTFDIYDNKYQDEKDGVFDY